MTEAILHHYPVSPSAEKVRAMLGFKRLAPAPSLYPRGDTLAVQAAAWFADNVMFSIAIPIAFQPGGGMIKLYFPDPRAGTMQVHFPRFGFQLTKAA